MLNRIIKVSLLVILSAALGYAGYRYPDVYLKKAFYSAVAFTLVYLVFRFLFEEIIARRISVPKTRYSFRKVVFILYLLVFLAVILAIWVPDSQTLIVSYGLIAAGVAFALQEVFKSIAGGIIIFVRGMYSVGDRIELNDRYGDVIDIGIMYTTLMELKEWVEGDQPTGRLTLIQNSMVLSYPLHNYTKDHPYIWDEIKLPVSYDSDWRRAEENILKIVETETREVTRAAEKSISGLTDKYYLPQRSELPAVYITLTDNWIDLHIRYITEVRNRRRQKDKLNRLILENFQQTSGGAYKIASSTLDVTLQNPAQTGPQAEN